MGNLSEAANWEPGVYQIEETDPLHGGEPNFIEGLGQLNWPTTHLANRTAWLKQELASLQANFAALDVAGDIDTRINQLLDGAPAALDTLAELATAIEGNDSEIAALVAQISGKLGVNDQAADAATVGGYSAQYLRNAGNLNAGTLLPERLDYATSDEYRAPTVNKVLMSDKVWGAMAEVSLTDAATVLWDLSTGIDFTLTLGGNRTLGNPTGKTLGKKGRLRLVQDATGGRTLSFHSQFKFANGAAPALSTAPGAVDILYYDIQYWDVVYVSVLRGVS